MEALGPVKIKEVEGSQQQIIAIVRQLESMGETELPSSAVGELVMKQLKALDDVAYVRYASVYRDFRETSDFARLSEMDVIVICVPTPLDEHHEPDLSFITNFWRRH